MGDAKKTRRELRSEVRMARSRVAELEPADPTVRENQGHFRLPTDRPSEIIILLDAAHRLVSWNRAAEEFHGLSTEEALGIEYLERFIPERFRSAVSKELAEVLADERLRAFAAPVRSSEAGERQVSWQASSLLDSNGRPYGVVVIGHAVAEGEPTQDEPAGRRDPVDRNVRGEATHLLQTDHPLKSALQLRVEAEKSLRESEQGFRAVADYTCNWENWIGPEGELLWMNPAVERVIGYSVEECMAKSDFPLCIIHEDDRGKVVPVYRRAVTDRTSGENFTCRLRHRDGRIVWVAVSWQQVYDQRGVHLGHRSSVRDVTQQREAEETLQRVSNRHQAILSAVPDIIMEVNSEKVYTWANQAGLDFFGEDVLGREAAFYFEGEQDTYDVVAPLFQGDESVIYVQSWQRRKDGEKRLLAWWCRALKGENGRPIGAISTARDITERKRVERELAAHRERLEELVEERTQELERSREELRRSERLASVGTLAAGMAHQINNPLSSILAAADYALICKGDPRETEIWERALKEAVAQAKRCGRIVRAILQFSRDEQTEKWCEDANEIARRACHLSSSYAGERGARVSFEAHDGECPVWMSPIEVEQALVNVIHNAIESRSEGARVEVRTRRTANAVFIDVRDDGVGLEAESIKHIFDPFYTTRLEAGGTGLGLSVAHGIIVDHRGSICVESEPNRGTNVTVELPLHVES